MGNKFYSHRSRNRPYLTALDDDYDSPDRKHLDEIAKEKNALENRILRKAVTLEGASDYGFSIISPLGKVLKNTDSVFIEFIEDALTHLNNNQGIFSGKNTGGTDFSAFCNICLEFFGNASDHILYKNLFDMCWKHIGTETLLILLHHIDTSFQSDFKINRKSVFMDVASRIGYMVKEDITNINPELIMLMLFTEEEIKALPEEHAVAIDYHGDNRYRSRDDYLDMYDYFSIEREEYDSF